MVHVIPVESMAGAIQLVCYCMTVVAAMLSILVLRQA